MASPGADPASLGGKADAGKAAEGMDRKLENAGLDGRIAPHDRPDLIWRSIEDAYPSDLAAVGDRTRPGRPARACNWP